MKRYKMVSLCILVCLSLVACVNKDTDTNDIKAKTAQVDVKKLAEGTPQFVVKTLPAHKWDIEIPKTLPEVDEEGLEWDLRHKDLRNFDLSKSNEFSKVSFDLATKWPIKLPDDFDPVSIMENGKNPGLGIRALHEQGITGKGVNIAIIDQSLLLNHQEYKDAIQMYETLHCYDENSSMHGSAVTSIAVGKTIGVAPDAKVYYIASDFVDLEKEKNNGESALNLSYMANGIERVLEINESLSKEDKIRVISISRGFDNVSKKDKKKVYEAIEKAKKENVLVITTSMNMNYDIQLSGLNRTQTANGDDINDYTLGSWIDPNYAAIANAIYVPMDSRTFAGFTSNDDYAYNATSGLSWTCPWFAGMYALCLQVNPNVTPNEFLTLASETGTKLPYEISSTNIINLNVVQPDVLIEKVKTMQ